MSRARKALFALFFLGFASNIGGAGTMASFNASTTNAQSTFASGSVVFTNTNEASGKICFSNGTTDNGVGANTDDNHNEGCEAAFNFATRKPGQTATAELTLKNEGSLDGTLKLLVAQHDPPGPAGLQTACSKTDATDTVYHGTGDICDKLQLTVQRWTDSTRGTPLSCVYGMPSGSSCVLDNAYDLKDFTETAANVSPGISIGTLDADGGDDTAWFTITVAFPDGGAGADNAFQGLVATMAIQWMLEQV